VKFCQFVSNLYPFLSTNFGRFVSVYIKMALIVLRVLMVFTMSSFEFPQVKLLWRHCQGRLVAPSSLNLSVLDYCIWGQCWSLMTSCNWSQKQFPSLRCTSADLARLTGESHWQCCADFCMQLQAYFSSWWTYWKI